MSKMDQVEAFHELFRFIDNKWNVVSTNGKDTFDFVPVGNDDNSSKMTLSIKEALN